MANLNLRGATYDAKHLDKFLGSEYGDRSFNLDRSKGLHNENDLDASVARNRSYIAHLPDYLVNSQSIKPSVSFLNLNREKMVFNHYIDL